jgi:hypothetical protein
MGEVIPFLRREAHDPPEPSVRYIAYARCIAIVPPNISEGELHRVLRDMTNMPAGSVVTIGCISTQKPALLVQAASGARSPDSRLKKAWPTIQLIGKIFGYAPTYEELAAEMRKAVA